MTFTVKMPDFTDNDILNNLSSLKSAVDGYCPVIIPPIRRAEYIAAMQKSNKGDLNAIGALVLSVIYEEMKSLKRLVESLGR